MFSINTNLPSLIAQNSMKSSTNKLNQSIERMTTGYKINQAKDNAANYSISTNIGIQLGAHDIAVDNVVMGKDLVSTASDIIAQMQNNASRLNALSTQARNGTYGAQSLEAINTEANALMSEIMRLYSTAEYNNISLFDQTSFTLPSYLPQSEDMSIAKAEYNGFIEDPVNYEQSYVDALPNVSSVTTAFTEDEYKVETVDDLVKLATLTNSGVDTTDITFILANNIDLGAWCDAKMATGGWVPIGKNGAGFKGTFDGNGHVIKNLKIDRNSNYQGLFGSITGDIKNLSLVGASVKAGKGNVGGLVGSCSGSILNCYITGNVTGLENNTGGLVGHLASSSIISKCYAEASVIGEGDYVGGLVGRIRSSSSQVIDSYATGEVWGQDYVGGFIGSANSSALISKSYATGNVTGKNYVAGFVGSGGCDSCYATGKVSGEKYVGGLVGKGSSLISSSYSTGNVQGESFVGGLVGECYKVSDSLQISNSTSYSKVSGADLSSTGTLIGALTNTSNGTSFGTLNLSNCESRAQNDMSVIGGTFKTNGDAVVYDLTTTLAGVSNANIEDVSTTLQVGIYSDGSCQIVFDTNFQFDLSKVNYGLETVEAFNAIVEFEKLLNEKATELGAVQNRLESALESIEVNINNLTSSLSTIRDADIAEVSSEYIQQQILQQATATLLATANQSPALALQLI